MAVIGPNVHKKKGRSKRTGPTFFACRAAYQYELLKPGSSGFTLKLALWFIRYHHQDGYLLCARS